jgi:putative alpha-1,2-mannosidase
MRRSAMKHSVAIVTADNQTIHVLTFPTHDVAQVMLQTMSKIRTTLQETTDIEDISVEKDELFNWEIVDNSEAFRVFTRETGGHIQLWNVIVVKRNFE